MKKLLISFALLVLVAASISCSPAPTTTPTTPGTPGFDRGNALPGAQPPVTTPPAPTPTPRPATPQIPTVTAEQAQVIAARLIVRNANMVVMVEDIKNAIVQITQLAQQKQGFVVSSHVPQLEQGATGSIVVRVPADEFETTMTAIAGLVVEVKSQSTSATDVTQEYTDLNSRLTNLQATEQQFLRILEKATTVTDILAVQKELARTREEIEVTKGQIQYLEQTSSTSLITVTLQQSKLLVKIGLDRPLANVDETITFHAETTGGFTPFSYQWDFGDKVTSTLSNPAHSYATNGDFKIKLKVTDNRGNVATDERTITISGGWSGGNVVRMAWRTLGLIGKGALNVLIWLAVFIPVWVVIGAVAMFFNWRRRRKGKGIG